MTTWRLMLLVLAGCSGRTSAGDDPPPQPAEPARFARPALVQFHMRRHFDDVRQLERALVAGKLDEAKALAFLLTKPASDPGMERWSKEIEAVSAEARTLVAARGIDDALRSEARVAGACAYCHARSQTSPVFPKPRAAPADDGSRAARMARHQWAADRLWEGIVGSADQPWRAGLEVLRVTPLPFSPLTDAPALADRLQALAGTALAKHLDASETMDDRTQLYGEMLVTCAACHRTLARSTTASK